MGSKRARGHEAKDGKTRASRASYGDAESQGRAIHHADQLLIIGLEQGDGGVMGEGVGRWVGLRGGWEVGIIRHLVHEHAREALLLCKCLDFVIGARFLSHELVAAVQRSQCSKRGR